MRLHHSLLTILLSVGLGAGVAVSDAQAQLFGGGGEADPRRVQDPAERQRGEDPSRLVLPGQVSRARAEQLANPETVDSEPIERAQILPSGGLRRLLVEETPPDQGERYQTVTQTEFDQRRLATEEELRQFAIPDDALTTGSVRADAGQVDLLDIEPADPLDPETDPYAALGVRAGPLTWFPSIDLAVGYDSNVDAATSARDVMTLQLRPEVTVESDWIRHAFNGSVAGTLVYVNDGRDLELSGEAAAALRLDVGLETEVTLRGGYALSGEQSSDANASAGTDGLTLQHSFTAGFDVARRVGILDATLSVDAERVMFGDSDLTAGGSQSNDDRNRTDVGLTLRLAQAEGPIFRPFVEGSVGLRRFDEGRDRNGFERNSYQYGAQTGVIVSDDGPISGEASIGLAGEVFDDSQLDDVLAFTAAAALTWEATALTTVSLDVATTLDPTTQAGSGVGVTRSAQLSATHDLRRNVELRVGAGFEDVRFSGINDESQTYSASAGATWRSSPVMAWRMDAAFEHEPNATGDINRFTAEAGITLRR